LRGGKINLSEIIDAAEIATLGDVANLITLQKYLQHSESAVRYWGVTGLLILGEKAAPVLKELLVVLNDKSPSVVTVAAEALYKLGEKEEAKKAFLRVLKNPNKFVQCYALNAIDCTEMGSCPELVEGVVNVLKARVMTPEDRYLIVAASKYLLEKWKVNPDEYHLNFD
jgi:HEAT repeat protein